MTDKAEAQGWDTFAEWWSEIRTEYPWNTPERNAAAAAWKAALVSKPPPAIDWQAVSDYLTEMARLSQSLFWGRLFRTAANALEAGIGGGGK